MRTCIRRTSRQWSGSTAGQKFFSRPEHDLEQGFVIRPRHRPGVARGRMVGQAAGHGGLAMHLAHPHRPQVLRQAERLIGIADRPGGDQMRADQPELAPVAQRDQPVAPDLAAGAGAGVALVYAS